LRLTVGSGTPSLRLAADRLPASATVTKSDIASRRSMFQILKDCLPMTPDY
jgi:hypothetical protein